MMLCVALKVNAQNETIVLGAGTRTCTLFLDDVRSSTEQDKEIILLGYETWVQGYLSGRNKQLDSIGYKQVDLVNVKQLGKLLTIACSEAIKQGYGNITVGLVIDKIFDKSYAIKSRK